MRADFINPPLPFALFMLFIHPLSCSLFPGLDTNNTHTQKPESHQQVSSCIYVDACRVCVWRSRSWSLLGVGGLCACLCLGVFLHMICI